MVQCWTEEARLAKLITVVSVEQSSGTKGLLLRKTSSAWSTVILGLSLSLPLGGEGHALPFSCESEDRVHDVAVPCPQHIYSGLNLIRAPATTTYPVPTGQP